MRYWQLCAAWTWTWLILVGGIVPAQGAEPPLRKPASVDPSASLDASVRKSLQEFDEWAMVQKTYEPAQIKQIRARFVAKVSQLSGSELEDFLDTVNQKLHILMSAEAKDARDWFSRTLAVASDSYAKQLESKLPDITRLTPSQLQDQLDEFEARRSSFKQSRAGFDKVREDQVQAVKEESRQLEQERKRNQAKLDSANNSGYSPSYAPRQYVRPSTVRPFGDTFRYSDTYRYGGYRW